MLMPKKPEKRRIIGMVARIIPHQETSGLVIPFYDSPYQHSPPARSILHNVDYGASNSAVSQEKVSVPFALWQDEYVSV